MAAGRRFVCAVLAGASMVLLAGSRAEGVGSSTNSESMQAEEHAGAVGSSASIPPDYGILPGRTGCTRSLDV